MISVITPHYNASNPFIEETYRSLAAQTLTDWQWVIVLNNGGVLPEAITLDRRVKVSACEDARIGFLKRFACEQADGAIIVELDSDDLLTERALEVLKQKFDTHPTVPFMYSNFAEFHHETWMPSRYNEYYGWQSRPFTWHGHMLIEQIAMPPTPAALRSIHWSPNHVRAWRKADYFEIGGHNPELSVADDYDLCCRFYLHGPMMHIDECLYLYRIHGGNTTVVRNASIQGGNAALYPKYIIPMVETWARRENYAMLDLGGGFGKPVGYIGLDRVGADMTCDLEQGIPFPDGSVGVVRAYDFMEHVHAIRMMNEIHRVLAPGGWLLISVPSTDGRGAFQDPTHISFWNENSFWYYTNPAYAKYVHDIRCRFQVSRVITWFPSDWHREHNIPYVDAQLIAVKGNYHSIGEDLWRR